MHNIDRVLIDKAIVLANKLDKINTNRLVKHLHIAYEKAYALMVILEIKGYVKQS